MIAIFTSTALPGLRTTTCAVTGAKSLPLPETTAGHPRIHMLIDVCGKQNKGRRYFCFLVNSVRQIGFFIDHHFLATSHFKGCHDGIGGVAKNAMRRQERLARVSWGWMGS